MASMKHSQPSFAPVACLFIASIFFVGCSDDSNAVREIQAKRQERLQSESKQDHLKETFALLGDLVNLNRSKADRQMAYHLNQWRNENPIAQVPTTKLIKSVNDLMQPEAVAERIEKEQFRAKDIDHLRDCYLFSRVVGWTNTELNDDQLLKDWLESESEKLGSDLGDQLRTATRMFDWTVRNIALEPMQKPIPSNAFPMPKLDHGMRLGGPGYRQSDYQTLWRGSGDGLQRGAVFIQLCRQAGIDAAVLAIQSSDTGKLTPWCVGVLIGKEVYLFEASLGVYIPGPDQKGIAKLSQARRDDSVTRRLSIPGFDEFKFAFSKKDVQQSVALLNLTPESVAPRMKTLQSRLTGDRRMTLYVDADAQAEKWDAASGIGGVQAWDKPFLNEAYAATMKKQAELHPAFAFWHISQWVVLDGGDNSAETLSKGRWQHLHGVFGNNEDDTVKGARALYMSQRAPEFEIEDLINDVELQRKYFRRELGSDIQDYKTQLRTIQEVLKLGKRTATYWLSLVQFSDGRIDTSDKWFARVLDKNQRSVWQAPARYNQGRAAEQLNDSDRAIELYKTSGDSQEHGNRIRARLLSKASDK